ncbi:hypothetical protein RZS08_21725, partial [Arthrospira platensis SPKY1]|nr:hypothetical protein [Arthrospira platensis SPKY1]
MAQRQKIGGEGVVQRAEEMGMLTQKADLVEDQDGAPKKGRVFGYSTTSISFAAGERIDGVDFSVQVDGHYKVNHKGTTGWIAMAKIAQGSLLEDK